MPKFPSFTELYVHDKHEIVIGSDSMGALVMVSIDTVKTPEIPLAVFVIFDSLVTLIVLAQDIVSMLMLAFGFLLLNK